MSTVNSTLLAMAQRQFEKSAVVPSDAAMAAGPLPRMDAQLGVVTPQQAAQGAAPQGDPSQGAAPPVDPSQDPTGAATAAMPPSPPPAAPAPPAVAGAAAGQKLKPEQMMQMLDYRLYNMQQQLTAIMNAMGVQVDPATLVLPPGTTGAPPAESALPGGPMAPPPQDPSAANGAPAGPQAPGGPMPPGGPMDPSQPPVDPNAGKQANWWDAPVAKFAAQNANEPTDLQNLAEATKILLRNL